MLATVIFVLTVNFFEIFMYELYSIRFFFTLKMKVNVVEVSD